MAGLIGAAFAPADAMDAQEQEAYRKATGDTIGGRPIPSANPRPDQGVTPIPANVMGLAKTMYNSTRPDRPKTMQEAIERAKAMTGSR